MQSFVPSRSRLAIAVRAALASAAIVLAPLNAAFAVEPAAQAGVRSYAIAAGPLADRLAEFAAASGVQILFDANTLKGLRSEGLSGSYSIADGFQRLMQGSGFEVVVGSNGEYGLRKLPKGEVTLKTVDVRTKVEESATGPVRGYAAKRSATAMKTDTPIVETPLSISVIGREEMEARGVQDIMDIVRYSPGITTNIYGSDNRGWEDIQIRGFSTYYSSFRDGLAQTPAGITYPLTEPYGLERVEVLRGPASMVFGRGDAGGIINRVSKTPTGSANREIEFQYGSDDRRQVAFDVGDRFGDSDFSYRVIGLGLDSDDEEEYPDGHKLNRERQYFAPSLRWESGATSLTLLGEYLKNKSPEDPYYVPVPGGLTDIKMGDYSFSQLDSKQGSLGYQFETALGDDWVLRQNLRHSRYSVDRRVVWIDSVDDDGHTLHRYARTWDDPMRQTSVDTNAQGKLTTGALEHTLLLGVDWGRQVAEANRFRGAAPDLDMNNPVYGQPIATPTVQMADYEETNTQLGIYVQDQIRIADRWVVMLGGREDRVKSELDDYLNKSHGDQKDNAFSGRAGVTYLIGNGWAPYISYTESFLPNSGTDVQGDLFDPSSGKQIEAGIKYQPEDQSLLLTAAVFDLRKTNVVTYDPISYDARQIGKQRSRGIELEAKGEVATGLNLSAAYTLLDFEITKSADPEEIGSIPPGVAERSASVWLDYLAGNGLGAGAGVRYVGKRPNDEYNTSFVSSFTVVDATVHYELGPWWLALNVGNLFDRDYFSICYHGECYRDKGRSTTLTAKYNF